MKRRAMAAAVIAGACLVGCASIVGIGDLPPDGGSPGSGSGAGGSSSGANGGSSSGVVGGSSGSVTGSSSGATCSIPSGAACAVDPQCGCADGEKCDLATGVAGCTVPGAGTAGALCATNSACATGLSCVSGTCHPYCLSSQVGAQCPADPRGAALDSCIQLFNGTVPIPQDSFCLIACDPVPSSCPGGEGCNILTDGSGKSYTDCEAAGTTPPGQTCAANVDCAPGSSCIAFSNGDFCGQWCRSGVAGDCPGTETCTLGTTPPVLNGVTYGVCE